MCFWFNKQSYHKITSKFRNIKDVTYTITYNKLALLKFNNEEMNVNIMEINVRDEYWITTYPLGSNIPFTKYFDNKDIPNSIEELKKINKTFFWKRSALVMLQDKT